MKPTRQQLKSEGKARRDAWKDEQRQFCWVCGKWVSWNVQICVHHIMERNGSPERWDQPHNYFLICWGVGGCHTDDFHNMPDAEQLAIKQKYDPDGYDLLAWCLSRNENAPEYVTQAEVDEAHLIRFLGEAT